MQKPCEQFGAERAHEIDGLIEAATGAPCPGRNGEACPFEPLRQDGERHLKVVAS